MYKKIKGISLKYLYLFSSFGIVLLACSLVGLLLYFNSIRNLRNVNERQMVEKLMLFADDLETQKKALADISYKLSTEVYYKKFFFERNSYYEIELFKEFEKLKNDSPIVGDYFMIYNDTDWVLRSTKTKITFEIFEELYGLEEYQGNLYETIMSVEDFKIVHCGGISGDTLIFMWPVYTGGRADESGRATVGFFVPPQNLQNRLKMLTGEIEGELYLYYNEQCFVAFNANGITPPDAALFDFSAEPIIDRQKDKTTYYALCSESGLFKILLRAPSEQDFGSIDRFLALNIAYVVVVVLLLLASAILVGYGNYMPIKRLSRKYKDFDIEGSSKNELENIELLFDSMLKEKENAEINLQTQYEIIKNQILKLLLNGDSRYSEIAIRPFMGIYMPGPLYYVVVIKPDKTIDENKEAELAALVEKLSENGMYLYFINTKYEDYYASIVSAMDEGTGMDAVDFIKTLFDEQMSYTIGVSAPCDSLSRLQDAFSNAVVNCSAQEKTEASSDNAISSPLWFDDEVLERMLIAMEIGNIKDAIFLFGMLDGKVKENTSSYIYERLIYHNILYRIDGFAKEQGVVLTAGLIDPIVQSVRHEDLTSRFEILIRYICEAIGDSKRYDESNLSSEIISSHTDELLDYIEKNYYDRNMSLDLLSQKFKLCNRYISNLIKDKTGLPYKEYLINIRIKRAQELLLTKNMTVTEACDSVGYAHLPHFIKTFKRITGFTPSNYNKRKQRDENSI